MTISTVKATQAMMNTEIDNQKGEIRKLMQRYHQISYPLRIWEEESHGRGYVFINTPINLIQYRRYVIVHISCNLAHFFNPNSFKFL